MQWKLIINYTARVHQRAAQLVKPVSVSSGCSSCMWKELWLFLTLQGLCLTKLFLAVISALVFLSWILCLKNIFFPLHITFIRTWILFFMSLLFFFFFEKRCQWSLSLLSPSLVPSPPRPPSPPFFFSLSCLLDHFGTSFLGVSIVHIFLAMQCSECWKYYSLCFTW